MKLIIGIVVLITYHQAGEWLVRFFQWSIPGSVLGMLMMFITLMFFNKPPEVIKQSSEFLLRHLALFFVPAGVGIMLLFNVIANEWLAMLISMVLSTLISLVFTAGIMQLSLKSQSTTLNTDE